MVRLQMLLTLLAMLLTFGLPTQDVHAGAYTYDASASARVHTCTWAASDAATPLFTATAEGSDVRRSALGGTATTVTDVENATEAATPRETLFHYTDEAGQNGILDSGQLNPSLKSANPADARYGNGQYLSDVQPGSMSCAQLSRCFLGQPFQGSRFTNYVEIDVTGLDIIKGRPGVFVNPSETPLDLTGRIVSWGRN